MAVVSFSVQPSSARAAASFCWRDQILASSFLRCLAFFSSAWALLSCLVKLPMRAPLKSFQSSSKLLGSGLFCADSWALSATSELGLFLRSGPGFEGAQEGVGSLGLAASGAFHPAVAASFDHGYPYLQHGFLRARFAHNHCPHVGHALYNVYCLRNC